MGYGPGGWKESDTTELHHFHFSLSCIGEGNGNPLQCFFLENPRERGAWWAGVYGVTQSQTRLTQLAYIHTSGGERTYIIQGERGNNFWIVWVNKLSYLKTLATLEVNMKVKKAQKP